MTQPTIMFRNVSFTYDTAGSPLLEDLTTHFPAGWTGIVGPNGAGKTTILRLATGQLQPQQGSVKAPRNAIYCPQRTDDVPPMFDELIRATDGDACEIKGRLGIEDEWLDRWDTLSHGERKRAQIGVVLWRRPPALAVDEPTNHIDAEARDLLAAALRSFRGVGLLVSHDRELLDALCRQCLFVEPPEAIMRPGGYSAGSEQAKKDQERKRREYDLAKRTHVGIKREVARRREVSAQARAKLSKRGLGPKERDARAKIDLARISGRDALGGKLMGQLAGRLKRARERREGIEVRKTYDLGIWLPGSRSRRDALLRMPGGSIPLGGDRRLNFPDLVMRPDDRIALTGPNGTGKSTLVRHLVRSLDLPEGRVIYMPQEIDLRSSKDVLSAVRGLAKNKLGHLMTVVSCLGSRPQRLLESTEPSPGEIRKLLLAIGITRAPHLIVMDEPTNHLDLPSIECLEKALDGCPCGLLLVSHDRRFLKRLTTTHWRIRAAQDESADARMVMNIAQAREEP